MRLSVRNTGAIKLPRGKSEHFEWDDEIPGFGLRLREGGSSSFVFQYKIGSKHRRITFGKYPALDANKARAQAAELHAKVKLGQDPAGAKASSRARASETFEACAKKYLIWQRQAVRSSTYKENERHLLRNLAPLHGLRIDATDKRSIAAQLTRLATEVGPVQANRTRASLSKFLNWCLREGLIESNQAVLTNVNEETERKRVLSNAELVEIWKALPENDYGAILKILILTGQRKREIGNLHWSEIDFDKSIITLPEHRTKNGCEHTIPMSAAVSGILKAQIRRDGRALVFGVGQGGFNGWSKAKERLDQAIKKPMERWIVHDLRRTVATHMAELIEDGGLEILPHVIEAVLNYTGGHKAGTAGIYNKASYAAQKANALGRWAEHITSIVEGRQSNVAPFKRA